jgi:hypothetical protein
MCPVAPYFDDLDHLGYSCAEAKTEESAILLLARNLLGDATG